MAVAVRALILDSLEAEIHWGVVLSSPLLRTCVKRSWLYVGKEKAKSWSLSAFNSHEFNHFFSRSHDAEKNRKLSPGFDNIS